MSKFCINQPIEFRVGDNKSLWIYNPNTTLFKHQVKTRISMPSILEKNRGLLVVNSLWLIIRDFEAINLQNAQI